MTYFTKARAAVVSGFVLVLLPLTAGTAQAAPTTLTPAQQQAVSSLNQPAQVSVGKVSTSTTKAAASVHTAATVSRRLTLYRGSFLMWARDTANWYVSGGRLSSSSLQQEAGYVFPNTSQAKGATRYYASSTTHSWRGNYTIGAGTVTPWGAVNIYSSDYSTDWQLHGDGSGSGRWN